MRRTKCSLSTCRQVRSSRRTRRLARLPRLLLRTSDAATPPRMFWQLLGRSTAGVGGAQQRGQMMTQLARRALLLVVLLLAWADAASGQSAWGLWQRTGSSSRRLGTFNTESDCRTAALRGARSLYDMQSRRKEIHPGTFELHGTEVHIPAGSRSWVISFDCFADMSDSR